MASVSVAKMIGSMPAWFEPNLGQMNSSVLFAYKHKGNSVFLTAEGLVLAGKRQIDTGGGRITDVMKIQFEGADRGAALRGAMPQGARINRLIGNDPSKWITGIPAYEKVMWSGTYPGIDVIFYGSADGLEFDYVLSPGAHPETIRLLFNGCDRLEQDELGNLLLSANGSTVTLLKPKISQLTKGARKEITGGFRVLNDRTVGLELGLYDAAEELLIDPAVLFSTYLGGNEQEPGEGAYGVAVDKEGCTYVTGYTSAPDFPVQNALQPTLLGTTNAFITKYKKGGRELDYSTYLGGSDVDFGTGIALDGQGNVYLSGYTSSKDFPVVNGFQSTLNGIQNAFVTKLNPTGNGIVYSTYLGGSALDAASAVAVDGAGSAFVTGSATSEDFPVRNAVQPALGGVMNAFIAKLSPSGSSLIYSTYLGGSSQDAGNAIALGSNGAAYITGNTDSPDLPVKNAFQPRLANAQGIRDAFVAKLNGAGSDIDYCTYLGGNLDDFGSAIAVDRQGSAFVTGTTFSGDFPVLNALQPGLLGTANCFITRFAPDGRSLVFSTYLGGSGYDYSSAITLGGQGDLTVSGATTSANFPVQNPIQPLYAGNTDAFLSTLSSNGSVLKFSSFIGGINADFSNAVAAGKGGTSLAGVTMSNDFPTKVPVQPALIGTADGFVAQITDGIDSTKVSISMKASQDCVYVCHMLEYRLEVRGNGPGSAANVVVVDRLPANAELIDFNAQIGSVKCAYGKVFWTIGELREGQTVLGNLTVRIKELGDAVNTAKVYADENGESRLQDRAVVVTKTKKRVTTGPMKTDCHNGQRCGTGKCELLIDIKNTSNHCAAVRITVIDLTRCEQKAWTTTAPVQPHCASQLVFRQPPRLYEVVFDDVTEGICLWTTVRMAY
jgi:uncharacterized repeat protein (TIGR01451 family)